MVTLIQLTRKQGSTLHRTKTNGDENCDCDMKNSDCDVQKPTLADPQSPISQPKLLRGLSVFGALQACTIMHAKVEEKQTQANTINQPINQSIN